MADEDWVLDNPINPPAVIDDPDGETEPPPPSIDEVNNSLQDFSDLLNDAYDTANQAAAAAADAAANADTALTAANGKNKVTYSLNAPGNTPNTVGDIWFRKESSTQTIIGQWEGLGGTSWSAKTLANAVIANLDAGKLTAGSAFINALSVKTNFTLGDATTDGVIQSFNFANSSVGVFINKNGLVAKGGSIAGAAITGGIVSGAINRGGVFSTSADTTDANYLTNHANRLQMRTLDNAGILEGYTGNSVLTFPGRMTISTGTDGADSAGRGFMRLSSPTDGSYSPAYVEIASKPVAGTGSSLYSDYIRMKASNFVIDGQVAVQSSAYIQGSLTGGPNLNWNMSATGALTLFSVSSVNDVKGGDLYATNAPTTGSSINAVMGSGGRIFRNTSSRRYKANIKNAKIDTDAVLKVQERSFTRPNDPDNSPDHVFDGVIAEEVHDLGLTQFVTYDEQNRPDGFKYAEFSVALLAVAKKQQKQIDDLTARLAALEAA